jgi:hypothetical protein
VRRSRIRSAALFAAVLALGPLPAAAQDRPTEDELFGTPPPPPREQPGEAPRPEEAELFGATGSPAAPAPPGVLAPRERDDPLHVGGQLYLRGATTWHERAQVRDWTLASPNLLDLYLDTRPNDRVRAFALGRMRYDPTFEGALELPGLLPADGLETTGSLADLLAAPRSNPDAVLDQLWLNFDVRRRVFVTAGKQHVKWGVGRFWNPTDYLHAAPRDPLAVFDARTGTTMVKLHAPWEARGWNAYGVVLLEDTGPRPVATRRVGRVGAGGRTEIVLGTFELGLDALLSDGRRPRLGVDASLGVWELDLYAEAALRRAGGNVERWRRVPGSGAPLGLEPVRHAGLTPQVVLGGTWSAMYSDEDLITVGAEYFYDRTGYDDATIYPYLLAVPFLFSGAPSPFSPFYLGRHQAAVFASLPRPGSWNDTTLTASLLGNLSDGSFVVRLDHSVLLLTYLRLETYVAGHLGTRGGVHRFALDVDPAEVDVPFAGRIVSPPPVLDLGIALRVSL